jgi:heptosyltransferase-2
MGGHYLIVKIAALGDIAVASALVREIRTTSPDAHVTWLTGERGAPLVRLFDGIERIVTVDEARLFHGSKMERARVIGGVWSRLGMRRFDHVLLLHADRRYRLLTMPVRYRQLSRLEHGVIPRLDRDRAGEYVRLLNADRTPDEAPALMDIRGRLPPRSPYTSDRPVVALVPGGARNVLRDDGLRRWPVENYRSLAGRLIGEGFDVLLLGDSDDTYVREHFSGVAVTDRIGQWDLVETLCALRDAMLLVTHDTGPLHFARLVRTPAVGLFGPTDPRHVVGSAADISTLWGGAHLPCRPCYDGRDYAACQLNVACMRDVGVDAVFRMALSRLRGSR